MQEAERAYLNFRVLESLQELLIKMTFIHEAMSSLLNIMKVLELEKSLVHEVCSLLGISSQLC